MTYLEAIRSENLFDVFTDDKILLAFELRSIDPNQVVDESSLKDLELIKADLYVDVSLLPDFTEGGLTIKYNRQELWSYVTDIANKYSDEKLLSAIDIGGAIKDITEEW